MMNKEPFVVGTAKRTVKTPANNVARKLLSKPTSHTDAQPIRVKPRVPPPSTNRCRITDPSIE